MNSGMRVLIVDDEDILRIPLCDDLKDAGFDAHSVPGTPEAFKIMKTKNFDVIITDLRLCGMDGITFLKKVKEQYPSIVVILMTAYGSVQSAVEAMKLGAYDYLTKPFSTDELIILLQRIWEVVKLKKENIQLKKRLKEVHEFHKILGKSKPMQEIYQLLSSIADSGSSVLITGETGTGKEMVADAIHHSSSRKNSAYIKVNCAILSPPILESELFGHEKGAFTGAHHKKKGRFEVADGGTLFLDDVDDIPLELQVKLLRVLQDKKFEVVGGIQPKQVDVRILAATKVDLLQKVNEGTFRADLFYRLNVVPVVLPPLRERPEDIPLLLSSFLKQFSERELKVPANVMDKLLKYTWPGNVRELKNLAERLTLTVTGNQVSLESLPDEILCPEGISVNCYDDNPTFEEILERTEIALLKKALTKAGGNKSKAASLLNLKTSTFRSKLEKYKL